VIIRTPVIAGTFEAVGNASRQPSSPLTSTIERSCAAWVTGVIALAGIVSSRASSPAG
jgi:hypothetical protein